VPGKNVTFYRFPPLPREEYPAKALDFGHSPDTRDVVPPFDTIAAMFKSSSHRWASRTPR
jgi:hypothetical protein